MQRVSFKLRIFTIYHKLSKVRNIAKRCSSQLPILDFHNLSLTHFPLLRICQLLNKAQRTILQSDFDQSQWKSTTFTFCESSFDFHLILLIFIGLFKPHFVVARKLVSDQKSSRGDLHKITRISDDFVFILTSDLASLSNYPTINSIRSVVISTY